MALQKISDFDTDYRNTFGDSDIKGYSVYSEGDEKIGSIGDILVDEDGRFRYFVVDLGFWIFGKKVLMPVGRARIDSHAERVYTSMSREQADNLPEFHEDMAMDYDYEERVRGVYRNPSMSSSNVGMASPSVDTVAPLETSASLDTSAPLDTTRERAAATPAPAAYSRDTYRYDQEPDLFDTTQPERDTLRLYEERLIANKRRVKTGEVTVGKYVETETERVSIPVEKERVVIERVTPTDAGRPVAPGEATFREGEVARMEIYEETPDVQKEAFVREEVKVRKEVDREIVTAEETVRREELDINTGNLPVDENRDRI